MSEDCGFKIWGRRAGYVFLALLIVAPFVAISWGRAQRSASAPAVIEEVFPQGNGRAMVGTFSFTVDGQVYRDQDEDSPTAGRGDRTWSRDELQGMQVCYDPERPGEDFALAPARYRCGDPDIITTD